MTKEEIEKQLEDDFFTCDDKKKFMFDLLMEIKVKLMFYLEWEEGELDGTD